MRLAHKESLGLSQFSILVNKGYANTFSLCVHNALNIFTRLLDMLLNELEVRLYLTRIGVEHSFKQCELPSLERLTDLHRAHLTKIPFENLSIVLQQPMGFGKQYAFEKIVGENRGGFCYELNYSFYLLLTSLRFNVKLISAQVFNRDKNTFGKPFDHLALLVDLSGSQYLVDVGFGDSFTVPISIAGRSYRETDGEYQVTRENKCHYLYQRKPGETWQPLYKFELIAQPIEAFERMSNYHQTNCESTFTQKSVCTRLTEQGRVTLSNGKLIRNEQGERVEIPVNKESQIRHVLSSEFDLYFSESVSLQALLISE